MIKVDLLQPADEAAWEAYVGAAPEAGIYHSLAWRDATREGLGHEPCYLCAKSEAGDVIGVLPLFFVRGWFGSRRVVSVPMRDRGGPVGRTAEAVSELLRGAVDLCRQAGAQYVDVRTLDPLDDQIVSARSLTQVQHWVTSRVDVSTGRDAAWKALHQKVRQHIRKAEGQGVTVEKDSSQAGVARFFDAFVRARTSMGIPPYPASFFDAIWRHLIRSGRANLFMVMSDGVAVNGLLNLLSKDTVIAGYSAPQRDWARAYPAEMAYWHTMAWAAESGYHVFDFGADSPAQEGLIAFKAKFGAQSRPMSNYFFLHRVASAPSADSSSPTYALARRVWSWLPDRWSRIGGAIVTKRLS